jgi:phytoene dehydrogenase-like protein
VAGKRVIIIGAGIAGLSAGIFALKNGFDVTVYESHFLPGGMCTAWKRKGFAFEGCLHYIQFIGTRPIHVFHRLWKELGILPGLDFIGHEIFHEFRDEKGRRLRLWADADRLRNELLDLSPADAQEIRALCDAIKRYAWIVRDVGRNPFLLLAKTIGVLRCIPLLKRFAEMNLAEYAARFKDPLIRWALEGIFVKPEFACISVFFILAGWHLGASGFPVGGSLALAKAFEASFLDLGGRLEYRRRIKRILVERGRAIGVDFVDGSVERADFVISAADGHETLWELLGDGFTPPELRDRYASAPLYEPFVQVSLGVDMDLRGEAHAVKVLLPEPLEVAGMSVRELWYQHSAYDSSTAPQGMSSLTLLYPCPIEAWETVVYQGPEYRAEKERVLAATIARLERIFPGLSEKVVVSDVATPCTVRRYTGSWRGTIGFVMTKGLAGQMTLKPQYRIPGLSGFYMTGQWVKGFGIPTAAMSGKEVIQALCKDQRMPFRA